MMNLRPKFERMPNGIYSTAETLVLWLILTSTYKSSFEKTFEQLDMIQKIVPIFAKTGDIFR